MICTKATQGAASDTSPIAGQAYRYLHFLHRYCNGTERTRHRCKCPSHTKRLRIPLMDLLLCAEICLSSKCAGGRSSSDPSLPVLLPMFHLAYLDRKFDTANRMVDGHGWHCWPSQATWTVICGRLLGLSRKAQSRATCCRDSQSPKFGAIVKIPKKPKRPRFFMSRGSSSSVMTVSPLFLEPH